jgi:predicted RecA/RadA family phage recombinase
MKNFIQDGANLDLTAPRGLSSGDGFIVGSLFAVAAAAATSGAAVVGVTAGCFTLPKLSTAVFAAGDKVSWDDTNHYLNVPGSGLYPVGSAIAAAGSGAATVNVKLAEVPTAAAA